MKKLTTGFYVPTQSFKSIYEHIAVMNADDQTLVAVCGPVDDDPENLKETMRQAKLFAAAPELLEALELSLEWIEMDLPGGSFAANKIRAAISKATRP
jgi:hypothetical protein